MRCSATPDVAEPGCKGGEARTAKDTGRQPSEVDLFPVLMAPGPGPFTLGIFDPDAGGATCGVHVCVERTYGLPPSAGGSSLITSQYKPRFRMASTNCSKSTGLRT